MQRQRDKGIDADKEEYRDAEMERQRNGQTKRWTDKGTDRQRDEQTERWTD